MSHTEFLTGTALSKDDSIRPLTERVAENPSVQKVLETTGQVYNVAKNYNKFTKWSLEMAENPVVYIADKTNSTFGPTLNKMDEYAGATVDKAGEIYTQKGDISRKVMEPVSAKVSKVSDDLLTRAERVVDAYLPEDGKLGSKQKGSNSERLVHIGQSAYGTARQRAYRLYLLVASVSLFLFAELVLLLVESARAVTLFTLTTAFSFIRAPRETLLSLLSDAHKAVLHLVYLALHPSELLALVLERFLTLQKRINKNLGKDETEEEDTEEDSQQDSGLRQRVSRANGAQGQ